LKKRTAIHMELLYEVFPHLSQGFIAESYQKHGGDIERCAEELSSYDQARSTPTPPQARFLVCSLLLMYQGERVVTVFPNTTKTPPQQI
jgi:hypothetical protein